MSGAKRRWLAAWLLAGSTAAPGTQTARMARSARLCSAAALELAERGRANRRYFSRRKPLARGTVVEDGAMIKGPAIIGRNCQINPWVTIGLSNSKKLGFSVEGPKIGDFVRIGTGSLGGKGRGLAFMNSVFNAYRIDQRFPDVRIAIPPTLVLATGVFDQFMQSPHLLPWSRQEVPVPDVQVPGHRDAEVDDHGQGEIPPVERSSSRAPEPRDRDPEE